MINKLTIKREFYPEVTNTPHFLVKLEYEGCVLEHEDIYFDRIDDLVKELELLERDRRGRVFLDGGFRFKIIIEMNSAGGIEFKFIAETGASFPGKLTLDGFFPINGEYAAGTLNSLIRLINSGDEFVI